MNWTRTMACLFSFFAPGGAAGASSMMMVPAFMHVLGKWNWWAPKPLARLHDKVGISESGGRRAGGTGAAESNSISITRTVT